MQPAQTMTKASPSPLQARLLLALLTALQLLACCCSPAGASVQPHSPPHQQCPTAEAALLRQVSLTGGPGGAQFPHRVAGPPAGCDPSPRAPAGRMRARLRVTTTPDASASGSRSFQLAVDTASGASVLTPTDPAGRTIHSSRRHGTFAISRTRLLGLLQCEKLPDVADQRPLLPDPSRVEAVLHFGYGSGWQLWLGRSEAHEVRILHAASGVCAVLRSWHLRAHGSNGSVGHLQLVEYSAHEFLRVGGDEAVFRLPTACYRVEL